MNPVDRLLGRVTMYRLVTIGLLAISVTAVALSALGVLFYDPLAVVVSAAVAVLASVASGRAFAAIARARQHTESTVITGLILPLLFWPLLDARSLGVLVLAAVVANASKYLIAVRGRHLLNPAAVGALVVGLSQLSGAVWWVGSSALLPVVAVVVLAVLRRTRRLAMAGVFLLVATAVIAVRLVASGQDVGTAVWTVLASYPVVFFAGVMLTEPLTLPPRRWQQLAEAVVVAVVMAVPFHLGPLSNTPELALVAGNVLAFAVGQRRGLRLEVVGSTRITPTVQEVALRTEPPVAFTAGQYLELTVPHAGPDSRGVRRMFSISSAPGPGPLTVAFTVPESASSLKRAMVALQEGAHLRATGVAGDFLLPKDPAVPVLLVAGGIGITPFASQLAAMAASGRARDVVLVYAVPDPAELAYVEVLAGSGARVVVVTPRRPGYLPPGWDHAASALVTAQVLAEAVPDARARVGYVAGPPAMVSAVRRALHGLGVRRVRTDAFTGY